MIYLGNFRRGAVVRGAFNTFDASDQLVTFAGTPSLRVVRGDGTAAITAGITLTVNAGGVTGRHTFAIDTSADAGYLADDTYRIEANAGTVGGQSYAGTVIRMFSLELSTAEILNAGQVQSGATASVVPLASSASTTVDVYRGSIFRVRDRTTRAILEQRFIASSSADRRVTLESPLLTAPGTTLDYDIFGAPLGAAQPDSTGVTTLLTRLSATRAAALDLIDVAISTRATVAGIWNALTAGLTEVGSIGKLLVDKLFGVSGQVASQAEVTAIQNNTRIALTAPEIIERPDTGTQVYRVELFLYDSVGNMEAPDSAPVVALVNQAGTDRSARLDSTTMTLVSTGRYRVLYTASAADAIEQLSWTVSVVEGGQTRLYGRQSQIVDTTAVDFTAADRLTLNNAASAAQLATAQASLTTLESRISAARAANFDNLNAPVSGTLAAVNYVPPSNSAIAAIQLITDRLGTMLEAASGGASRFTIPSLANAPTGSGGSGGFLEADREALEATLATVAQILEDTGSTGVVISDTTGRNIADLLLQRSVDGGEDGGNTVSKALQPSVNRVEFSPDGTQMTVYLGDGTTVSYVRSATRASLPAIRQLGAAA